MSATKLFVGSLAWSVTDEALRSAFEPYGPVIEAKVIVDKATNRSRGFGFVTFETPAQATEARQRMDGQEINGRPVRVDSATERDVSAHGAGMHMQRADGAYYMQRGYAPMPRGPYGPAPYGPAAFGPYAGQYNGIPAPYTTAYAPGRGYGAPAQFHTGAPGNGFHGY